jgi:hypothetical protein
MNTTLGAFGYKGQKAARVDSFWFVELWRYFEIAYLNKRHLACGVTASAGAFGS